MANPYLAPLERRQNQRAAVAGLTHGHGFLELVRTQLRLGAERL